MMWGLVLSALTIGVSLLGKKEGDEKSSASDRQVALTGNTQTFLSGIGTFFLELFYEAFS